MYIGLNVKVPIILV